MDERWYPNCPNCKTAPKVGAARYCRQCGGELLHPLVLIPPLWRRWNTFMNWLCLVVTILFPPAIVLTAFQFLTILPRSIWIDRRKRQAMPVRLSL